MKFELYDRIVNRFHEIGKFDVFDYLVDEFPEVHKTTLRNILSQEYVKLMKKTMWGHHKIGSKERHYKDYRARTKKGETDVLIRIAEEIQLCPALLARIIVDRYVKHTLYADVDEQPPKDVVSMLMKDPMKIDDGLLRCEVQLCHAADPAFGRTMDVVKRSVGYEYEFLLERKLKELNIPFINEDIMREQGYDKTPDVRLQVPIGVNGRVVNWIESKASFGDEEYHKEYLKNQLWSYWNRFGPGMVIYWFGFIDELNMHADKGIQMFDHLPEKDIVFLTYDKKKEEDRRGSDTDGEGDFETPRKSDRSEGLGLGEFTSSLEALIEKYEDAEILQNGQEEILEKAGMEYGLERVLKFEARLKKGGVEEGRFLEEDNEQGNGEAQGCVVKQEGRLAKLLKLEARLKQGECKGEQKKEEDE